jgi:hypothetical protein
MQPDSWKTSRQEVLVPQTMNSNIESSWINASARSSQMPLHRIMTQDTRGNAPPNSTSLQWVAEKGTSYDCRMYSSVKRNRWKKDKDSWFQFPDEQSTSPTTTTRLISHKENSKTISNRYESNDNARARVNDIILANGMVDAEKEFEIALLLNKQGHTSEQQKCPRTSIRVSELLL